MIDDTQESDDSPNQGPDAQAEMTAAPAPDKPAGKTATRRRRRTSTARPTPKAASPRSKPAARPASKASPTRQPPAGPVARPAYVAQAEAISRRMVQFAETMTERNLAASRAALEARTWRELSDAQLDYARDSFDLMVGEGLAMTELAMTLSGALVADASNSLARWPFGGASR